LILFFVITLLGLYTKIRDGVTVIAWGLKLSWRYVNISTRAKLLYEEDVIKCGQA
jgi:hypothetical protein